MIDSNTRTQVIDRAGNRCEYCHLPQVASELTLHIDHVIALQHSKDDDLLNLALCCPKCNGKKGPNLAGIDPTTREITPLFNPRIQDWAAHFRRSGPLVIGLTPCGRATVAVLDLNHDVRLAIRRNSIALGVLPPNE